MRPKVGDVLLNMSYKGMHLLRIIREDENRFYIKPIVELGEAIFTGLENKWFGKDSVFQTDSYNLRVTPKEKTVRAIFEERRVGW